MQSFYTVKQAAKIIKVSTNTIYTYLDEGKLEGKRIGKGRFKIPYSALASYLGDGTDSKDDELEALAEEITPLESSFEERVQRFFAGMTLFGLVVFTFISGSEVFTPKGVTALDLIGVLPFFLIGGFMLVAGFLMILSGFTKNITRKQFLTRHLIFVASIIIGSVVMVRMSLGELLISFSLAAITLYEIWRFLKKKPFTPYFVTITRFLVISQVSGMLLLSGFLKFVDLTYLSTAFISRLKFLLIILMAIYLITTLINTFSKDKQNNNFRYIPFFAMFITVCIYAASELINHQRPGIAFICQLIAIFLTFSIFHLFSRRRGVYSKDPEISLIGITSICIGSIIGLIFLYRMGQNIWDHNVGSMQNVAGNISVLIGSDFEDNKSEMRLHLHDWTTQEPSHIDPEAKHSIEDDLKYIYQEAIAARSILLIDSEGVTQGVYPYNAILENANLSSRGFFQTTRTTLMSYISPVFTSATGAKTIAQTEPLFSEGDEFQGMFVIYYDLEGLSSRYQSLLRDGSYQLLVTDDHNHYVLADDSSKIGAEVDIDSEYRQKQLAETYLYMFTNRRLNRPNWTVTIRADKTQWYEEMDDASHVEGFLVLFASVLMFSALYLILGRSNND